MATIDDLAKQFTDLLRMGQFAAAGDCCWAADITSIDPVAIGASASAHVSGKTAALDKCSARFSGKRIDELTVDGPFVTGNQFALFVDMVLVDLASDARQPFSEIALFTVRNGLIAEERHFYG